MHSKLVKMLNYLSKHILMFICIKKKKNVHRTKVLDPF